MTRVASIVQARMGSQRLPGKVLMPLAGTPVLEWVMHRLGRSEALDTLVVATSDLQADDQIAHLCRDRGWLVFRGSEADVLDRFYRAAVEVEADVVVRITADCPFVDPRDVDAVVGHLFASGADYVSNQLAPRKSAVGSDVEAFSIRALEQAWMHCDRSEWREHVTPFLYKSGRFTLGSPIVDGSDDSWMRITLDTPEDMALLDRVASSLQGMDFGVDEVRAVLLANPEWLRINAEVRQRTVPS